MLVAVLSGCAPRGGNAPQGQIALRYDGKSDSQYFFLFENRSALPVYVEGWKRHFWTDVMPSHTFGCNGGDKTGNAQVESWVSNNLFSDQVFQILPDARTRMAIERAEYTSQLPHRGERCRIELITKGKITFASDDFSP
jgi:hypothetical protein